MTVGGLLRYARSTMFVGREPGHPSSRVMSAWWSVSAAFAGLVLAAGCGSGPDEDAAAAVDPADHHCVALAMYWEARGEGEEGMRAIGAVILNRMEDERFPDTACAVIREGGETPPCQFSWWCDGLSDTPEPGEPWTLSLALAREVLSKKPRDPTGGALFFHRAASDPPWTREKTAEIGEHVFYR